LDLPWGAPIGFGFSPDRGDGVTANVPAFLERHEADFAYLFVSWQPRSRNRLDPAEYFEAWDDLFARVPSFATRALHQTSFNLGGLEPYDRGAIVEFTNALVARYGFKWVNEDLGLWSIHGNSLPYPLPPFLTDAGLEAAVANTACVQERLDVPLLVEFPGFSAGTSLCIGSWHAYDFFTHVVQRTDSPATLDIGHLLSYQWLLGRRGDDLFGELDRLPLEHCFEIHLSGCEISGDRFMDYHHGILLREQLILLERLVPRCPNLAAITYEDPKFDDDGVLVPASTSGFNDLRDFVRAWA
jgi:uncharacterized protein (UPF0276 family)